MMFLYFFTSYNLGLTQGEWWVSYSQIMIGVSKYLRKALYIGSFTILRSCARIPRYISLWKLRIGWKGSGDMSVCVCLPCFEGRDDSSGIYIYGMVNYIRGEFEDSNLVGRLNVFM